MHKIFTQTCILPPVLYFFNTLMIRVLSEYFIFIFLVVSWGEGCVSNKITKYFHTNLSLSFSICHIRRKKVTPEYMHVLIDMVSFQLKITYQNFRDNFLYLSSGKWIKENTADACKCTPSQDGILLTIIGDIAV